MRSSCKENAQRRSGPENLFHNVFLKAFVPLCGVLIICLALSCTAAKKEPGIEKEAQGAETEQSPAEEPPAETPAESSYSAAVSSLRGPLTLPPLPGGMVNFSELNPANYQKINREAMEGMGMAPYYVSYLSGEKFYREGDYDRAIAEYGLSISQKNDYADAYISRGNAWRKKGDMGRAIEDYTRAINIQGTYADVYNYRGFSYAQRGDFHKAIADYTLAIRYKTDYADAYFNRAYACGKLGYWDRAISDYTQVIKFEPANTVAYKQRGNAFFSKGDKSKAEADYEAAEKLGN
jgi:tetratricopeptide (TPR) repeat protein